MVLSLTGILSFAHTNTYSILDTRDIVVVELTGLYYYWTKQGAGGYTLAMTSQMDLTTIEDQEIKANE